MFEIDVTKQTLLIVLWPEMSRHIKDILVSRSTQMTLQNINSLK